MFYIASRKLAELNRSSPLHSVTGINKYSEIGIVSAVKFKHKSDLRIMIKAKES